VSEHFLQEQREEKGPHGLGGGGDQAVLGGRRGKKVQLPNKEGERERSFVMTNAERE